MCSEEKQENIQLPWQPHGRDLREVSPVALAFVGDGVYEVLVRQRLVTRTRLAPGRLHGLAVKFVSAAGQSRALEAILPLLTEEEYDGIVKLADFLKSLENGSHFIVKRTELRQIMCHDLTHLRAVDTVSRNFDLVCIKLARVTPCPWGMGIYTANEQKERVIAPAHPFPDPVRTVRCLLGGTAHSKSGNLIELVHRFRSRMVFSGTPDTVTHLRHVLVDSLRTWESVLMVLI